MIHPFTSLFQSYRWFIEDLPKFCAISILILSMIISDMPIPSLVINLSWWTVSMTWFLSSRWYLIPEARQNSRIKCFILFFPESQALNYIITKIHLNHCKDSPCVFNFSFFLSSFITGVLHGGSTWWFIKDSFHSSIVLQDFSRSYDPPSFTLK